LILVRPRKGDAFLELQLGTGAEELKRRLDAVKAGLLVRTALTAAQQADVPKASKRCFRELQAALHGFTDKHEEAAGSIQQTETDEEPSSDAGTWKSLREDATEALQKEAMSQAGAHLAEAQDGCKCLSQFAGGCEDGSSWKDGATTWEQLEAAANEKLFALDATKLVSSMKKAEKAKNAYVKCAEAAGVPQSEVTEAVKDVNDAIALANVTLAEAFLMEAVANGGEEGASKCQEQFEHMLSKGVDVEEVHPIITEMAAALQGEFCK